MKNLKLIIVILVVFSFIVISFPQNSLVDAEIPLVWDVEYDLHGSGKKVIKTEPDGVAIAGDGNGQFLLLKIDSNGNIQWNRTYGNGTAFSIIQTIDGGYALVGTGDNFNFIKTDSEGNLEWSKYYCDSDVPFHGQSLIQTSDGGYAFTGWTSNSINFPNLDWTIKTDSNGNIQWNKTYGLMRGMSHGNEILQTDDGGYILAANEDISKLDSNGNIQWTNSCVVASSLIKTKDGGYLISAGNGATLVKLDFVGTTEWSRSYQYQGSRWSFFNSAIIDSDGGYVVVGVTYPVYDGLAWITKIDEDGNVENEAVFPPESGINNNLFSIVEVEDGTYVFSGTKNAESKIGNVWIAKIGKSEIPEFSTWTILPLFLIATMSVIAIKKKLITKSKAFSYHPN
jgi:hypothetical protein